LLDCDNDRRYYIEEPESSYEVYYQESDLSDVVEDMDYNIVYIYENVKADNICGGTEQPRLIIFVEEPSSLQPYLNKMLSLDGT
jgi:hypothetical protein